MDRVLRGARNMPWDALKSENLKFCLFCFIFDIYILKIVNTMIYKSYTNKSKRLNKMFLLCNHKWMWLVHLDSAEKSTLDHRRLQEFTLVLYTGFTIDSKKRVYTQTMRQRLQSFMWILVFYSINEHFLRDDRGR